MLARRHHALLAGSPVHDATQMSLSSAFEGFDVGGAVWLDADLDVAGTGTHFLVGTSGLSSSCRRCWDGLHRVLGSAPPLASLRLMHRP